MAVLKHIAIKNADYSAAVCYLKYQHDERHLKPLLDENGNMMLRSEFHMNGVNCNPDTFDLECEMLNDQYIRQSDERSADTGHAQFRPTGNGIRHSRDVWTPSAVSAHPASFPVPDNLLLHLSCQHPY